MSNRHLCHWPGCRETVPPKLWGCSSHWFALPFELRQGILRTYRPGQEVTKTPSANYLAAARAVQDWIRQRTPTRTAPPSFHEPAGGSE